MNPRLLVNLGLMGMCAVLGWFAFNPEAPLPAPPTAALTTLSANQIADIRIERDGSAVAQLRRSGDAWRLESPIDAAADAFRVQTLIGLALARSHLGFRAAGNDLTQYGLQPPRATVRFNDTVLLIGDANPVDGHRYVMGDGQVHLLEDNWFSPIFGSAIAWLDPRLLPHGATPQAIELHPEPGVISRWHLSEGRWQRTPADSTSAKESVHQRGIVLAEAWRQARALSVQRRDPTLAWNARAIVTFNHAAQSPTGDASETIEFELARAKDALFFARADLDVQYRFLPRQGQPLLDARESR